MFCVFFFINFTTLNANNNVYAFYTIHLEFISMTYQISITKNITMCPNYPNTALVFCAVNLKKTYIFFIYVFYTTTTIYIIYEFILV